MKWRPRLVLRRPQRGLQRMEQYAGHLSHAGKVPASMQGRPLGRWLVLAKDPASAYRAVWLTIGFPGSPVNWGGSADVLLGWNDSHISPQGSSPSGFFTSLGKPYGCRLSFSAWVQAPKHPRQEKKPYCCLSWSACPCSDTVSLASKCQIRCGAVADSRWSSRFFFFKMKCSWFTKLGKFLVSSRVIQLHMYMCVYIYMCVWIWELD